MTTLLTNDNLAKMKNAQAQNLPETAYIQGLSTTNSASGWSELDYKGNGERSIGRAERRNGKEHRGYDHE